MAVGTPLSCMPVPGRKQIKFDFKKPGEKKVRDTHKNRKSERQIQIQT
jgi:hypothetical protein